MNAAEFDNLPGFDFGEALALEPEQRITRAVDHFARRCAELSKANPEWVELGIIEAPPSSGVSESELERWEEANAVSLPAEYRLFLGSWRYLNISDGYRVWGFGSECGSPSDNHRAGKRYLVIGDYFRFADGDQLLIDLGTADHPVSVYLHEEGGAIVDYAPGSSLALWRLVHESD